MQECARTAESPACCGRIAATSPSPRGSPRPACCGDGGTIREATSLRPVRVLSVPCRARNSATRSSCALRNLRRRARPSSWSALAPRARVGDGPSESRKALAAPCPAPGSQRCWKRTRRLPSNRVGRSWAPLCSSQAPYAFRRHHGPQALAVERGERRVVDDHREVRCRESGARPRGFPRAVGKHLRLQGVGAHYLRVHAAVAQARMKASRRRAPAPLRLLSTRCRAPHFTSHSASTLPKPPIHR